MGGGDVDLPALVHRDDTRVMTHWIAPLEADTRRITCAWWFATGANGDRE